MSDTVWMWVLIGIGFFVLILVESGLFDALISSFRKVSANIHNARKGGGTFISARGIGTQLITRAKTIGDKVIPYSREKGNIPLPIDFSPSKVTPLDPIKFNVGDPAGNILRSTDYADLPEPQQMQARLLMETVDNLAWRNAALEDENEELSGKFDDTMRKKFTAVGESIKKIKPPMQFPPSSMSKYARMSLPEESGGE